MTLILLLIFYFAFSHHLFSNRSPPSFSSCTSSLTILPSTTISLPNCPTSYFPLPHFSRSSLLLIVLICCPSFSSPVPHPSLLSSLFLFLPHPYTSLPSSPLPPFTGWPPTSGHDHRNKSRHYTGSCRSTQGTPIVQKSSDSDLSKQKVQSLICI